MANESTSGGPKSKKKYLSQSDVPSTDISDALRVAICLRDDYGFNPTAPIHVAKALDMQPGAGGFRMLTGASIAYGLTEGGAQSAEISLTELGNRIVRPLTEDDDVAAKREAFLKPRIIGEFLKSYDGAPLPREEIGKNVLLDMGVPSAKLDRVWNLIVSEARALGLTEEIKNKVYVHLAGSNPPTNGAHQEQDAGDTDEIEDNIETHRETPKPPVELPTSLRVFISHGKNMEIVEQVETMLGMADLEYEVAVTDETTAIPVPEKVFSAMRNCSAAVIVVSVEESRKEGDENYVINENVLIEIGAAFVLYDRKVVLVWDKRLPVPSNLQGLYRCDFEGSELSWKTGMKLMKAIKGFRE